MSNTEVFLAREDFISQAKIMQGSRDFGAQLFCALLRSAAIESRLVCSLQALPFSGTVKDMTPSKKDLNYIVVSSDDHETSTDEQKKAEGSPSTSRVRRLGRPEFSARPAKPKSRSGILQDSTWNCSTANLYRLSLSAKLSRILLPGLLG